MRLRHLMKGLGALAMRPNKIRGLPLTGRDQLLVAAATPLIFTQNVKMLSLNKQNPHIQSREHEKNAIDLELT